LNSATVPLPLTDAVTSWIGLAGNRAAVGIAHSDIAVKYPRFLRAAAGSAVDIRFQGDARDHGLLKWPAKRGMGPGEG